MCRYLCRVSDSSKCLLIVVCFLLLCAVLYLNIFLASSGVWYNYLLMAHIKVLSRPGSGGVSQTLTFTLWSTSQEYLHGLVQDCSKSSALAMELLQSCTMPWIWYLPVSGNLSPLLRHSLPTLFRPAGRPSGLVTERWNLCVSYLSWHVSFDFR